MFTKPKDKTELEIAISDLFAEMENVDKDSDQYKVLHKRLIALYALKTIDSDVEAKKRIGPEVKLTVAANLAGILLIVGHERAHVIASKALSFVMKAR